MLPDARGGGRTAPGHPRGNRRRIGMETFLMLNGFEIDAPIDEQERLMLDLAAGHVTREQLTDWLEKHLKSIW